MGCLKLGSLMSKLSYTIHSDRRFNKKYIYSLTKCYRKIRVLLMNERSQQMNKKVEIQWKLFGHEVKNDEKSIFN